MLIEEFIEELRAGNRLKRPFWGKEQYLELDGKKLVDQDGKSPSWLDVFFTDEEWEVIETEIEYGIYVDHDYDVYLYNGNWFSYDNDKGQFCNDVGINKGFMDKYELSLEIPGDFATDCKIRFKPIIAE